MQLMLRLSTLRVTLGSMIIALDLLFQLLEHDRDPDVCPRMECEAFGSRIEVTGIETKVSSAGMEVVRPWTSIERQTGAQ